MSRKASGPASPAPRPAWDARRRQLGRVERVHAIRAALDARQRLVVEEHGHAVAREPDVELHAVAGRARACAAASAASVFSGATRQSPRWARRSERGRAHAAPADADVRRDADVVRRVERRVADGRAVEDEPRILDLDGAAQPDVVEAVGIAVRVHRRAPASPDGQVTDGSSPFASTIRGAEPGRAHARVRGLRRVRR